MSRLLVVRHGQASSGSDDYDRLSPLGWRQAEALGRHWLAAGLAADAVWVGPRRRHRETAESVAAVYAAAGRAWPEPLLLPGLDEHDGYPLVWRALPDLARTDELARRAVERLAGDPTRDPRLYARVYEHVTRRWACGDLDLEGSGLEDWPEFRGRVTAAIESMRAAAGRKSTVVAFSSAGPVGVAVGHALALGDEGAMAASWVVRNASVTELLFTEERLSLFTFNTVPHLDRAELLTHV